MSQYSQLLTSFERTGDYPLEANYIFSTEETLKEFYSDPVNQATLYKGLLKVVENDSEGEQSLWWVVPVADSEEELEFKKLISFKSIEDLQQKLEELEDVIKKEIAERKHSDLILHEKIKELQRHLHDLFERSKLLKKELQATVGTESDDIISYLKTLPYKNLTEVVLAVHKFLDTVDSSNHEIQTLPELQKFLAGFHDHHNLHMVLEHMYKHILGGASEDYNTLKDLETAIKALEERTNLKVTGLQEELDRAEKGVGLEPNGNFSPDAYTYYLKEATSVMNALRILDALLYKTITTTNLDPKDTETIDMRIEAYADRTAISGQVKIASKSGNQIVIESDGIYHSVDFDYKNGRLDLIINGNIVRQFDLGLSGLVSSGRYDSETEEIVITLNTPDGAAEIRIPAHNLIEEWEVANNEADAVLLTKTRSIAGKDTLSATVKIAINNKNILQKTAAGELFVKGTADNIRMNSGITVEAAINSLNDNIGDYQKDIDSARDAVRDESDRAKDAEKKLEESIQACKSECQQTKSKVSALELEVDSLTNDLNDHKAQAEKERQGLVAAIEEAKNNKHSFKSSQTIQFSEDGQVISADLKIAGGSNNILKVDEGTQGAYATVDIGYDEVGHKIWLETSGGKTKEVQLSEGHTIDDIYYDLNERVLVFVFTQGGQTVTKKFPVADLFNDWDVKNPPENSAIELIKTHNIKDQNSKDLPDTLEARLLIADMEHNAARIVGNALFVSNEQSEKNAEDLSELKKEFEEVKETAKDAAKVAKEAKELVERFKDFDPAEITVKLDDLLKRVAALEDTLSWLKYDE